MDKKDLPNKSLPLIELVDCGYVTMSLGGHVLETNTALGTILGYSGKLHPETNFFSQFWALDLGQIFVDSVREERVVRDLLSELKQQNGTRIPVSITAQYVQQNDENAYIECLISQLPNPKTHRAVFDETLRNVSGGIAHLINNQMASVVGTADLMKKELKDYPKLAAKLDRISQCGLQASEVAHNLVEYAGESGAEIFESLHLNRLVLSVADKYEKDVFPSLLRKFSYDIAKEVPTCWVNGQQVLSLCACMLDNAIEATEDGGSVILMVQMEHLKHQSSGESEEYVMISIQDDGVGMGSEIQRRIFEPYFSTKFMGRGMSLARALKMIKVHDGRIHVKTGENLGSIFKIYFPVEKHYSGS